MRIWFFLFLTLESMSLVSVILPVKNAEDNLPRAIQSIRGQSHTDWELLVVDDGSTDQSHEVAVQSEKTDARIRSIYNPGVGIVSALNHGISKAKGQLIARMDADDVSKPDRLREQITFLKAHPEIGLVGSRVNYLGDREQNAGYAAYVDWTNKLLSPNDIRTNRFVESPLAHPSVMFRRSLVREGEGPYRDGPFPEDYELWLRWIDKGVQMAKLNSPLLDWYDPPQRLSRTDQRYSPESFYRTKATYLAKWLQISEHIERPIWIWGAGRKTRKRTRFLEEAGIQFTGYLDIDPKKTGSQLGGIPVLQPDDLNLGARPFIISYVGARGARDLIRNYLLSKKLLEESDFILAA